MKLIIGCLLLLQLLSGCGCQPNQQTAYSDTVMDSFDTVITVVAYADDEDEFNTYFEYAQHRFAQLHQFYDKYNSYQGVNNVKTINDMAGIEPVKVEQDLLDLIQLGLEWGAGDVKTNIALGPVLDIWHEYREQGRADAEQAQLPPLDELQHAAQHTDIDQVELDEARGTVFLPHVEMALDVGAIAKGYATELVAQELMAVGLTAGAISSGGNVRVIGSPPVGGHDDWTVNIMNPDSYFFSDDRDLDTAYVSDTSVVTSGDYQRYYYVDGVPYHHLIDPDTLMPADNYRALTVVTRDSGYADLLATELFLVDYAQGRQMVQELDEVEVLWILPDGQIELTPGMKDILASYLDE